MKRRFQFDPATKRMVGVSDPLTEAGIREEQEIYRKLREQDGRACSAALRRVLPYSSPLAIEMAFGRPVKGIQ